jgi:hypothetical protein
MLQGFANGTQAKPKRSAVPKKLKIQRVQGLPGYAEEVILYSIQKIKGRKCET